jgi:hypothetical protein
MTTKAKPESAVPIPLFFSNGTNLPSQQSRFNPAHLPPSWRVHGSEGIQSQTYLPKKRYLVTLERPRTMSGIFRHCTMLVMVCTPCCCVAPLYCPRALALMFYCKLVHRDVSTGNIIVLGVGDEACGKLSDLKFAKRRALHSSWPTKYYCLAIRWLSG